MSINLIEPEKISLKTHPTLNESWLQGIIADKPEILGLGGNVILKDKERRQPRAGRLDILLENENNKRYEVEIQLGKVDASHIIRTLEYWDIERKRYPQYEHCAVIIAEEITTRFLNVIGLFNGAIPLIAIQLTAYKTKDDYFLTFNKILDEMTLGFDDENECSKATDRSHWEKKGTSKTLKFADNALLLINEVLHGHELKYNQQYIGLTENGEVNNFIRFEDFKDFTRIAIRLEQDDKLAESIRNQGVGFRYKDRRYEIDVTANFLENHKELFKNLVRQAKNMQTEDETE